jgi:hypothetical protein
MVFSGRIRYDITVDSAHDVEQKMRSDSTADKVIGVLVRVKFDAASAMK